MRTSTLKRGGRACSSLTRTPRPITVANEQCVMVGVISTITVLIGDLGDRGGSICMSGRLTTAREPKDSGCSGSEIVEIRSARGSQNGEATRLGWAAVLHTVASTHGHT